LSDKKELWASLPKIKNSEIDVIGLTLYFDESFVKTNYYDGVKTFWDFYQHIFSKTDAFWQIKESKDLVNKPDDRVGYFFSIEGLHCLRSPEDFIEFYDLGVRSVGFTWSCGNDYAGGRDDKVDAGLTLAGLEVVKLMNEKKKIIIDIAHLGEKSARDIEKKWQGMMVTTHGNSRSVFDSSHNLTDDEVKIIVERGGVVSLFPLTEDAGEEGTFEELYRHLDYIASGWGIEHVAFSTDIYPLPEYPFINNAKDITIAKDWSEYLLSKMDHKTVEQVLWGNWVRVLKESL
jgi:membrane dipeptidase